MKQPTGIAAPPLTLDDGDAQVEASTSASTTDLYAALRGPSGRLALSQQTKDDLRRTSETSPLVNTQTHRPPKRPEPRELVMRDGYTMPQADYALLRQLDELALRCGCKLGKSGVLRLGVRILASMEPEAFVDLARALPPVPTGAKKRR